MARTKSISKSSSNGEALLDTLTKGYRGPLSTAAARQFVNINRPVFYRSLYVPQMMQDPRVSFGIKLIMGPMLSKAKFVVDTESEEVRNFLIRQITRFWTRGAPVSLKNLIWGYSGSEIIYKFNRTENLFDFYKLKFLHPGDIRPFVGKKSDEIEAMQVKNMKNKGHVFVPPPKFFWSVHDKTHDRWFGKSRLQEAFVPWWEIWMPRGYMSIRQMWFYKNAFAGCVVRFPQGSTKDKSGAQVPNMLLAEEMADRYMTGSSAILPKEPDGANDWELEPGKGISVPDGLLEYGEILGDQIWEGLGIPPEVVSADGTGSFAGRRVPQQAFYSVLQEIIDEHIIDADEQIFRPLVELNFGPVDYEINTISLLDTLQREEMGLVTGKIDDGTGNEEEETNENDDEEEEVKILSDDDQKIEDRKSNPHNRQEEQIKKNQKKE